MSVGELSAQGNPIRATVRWGNVRSGSCPFGELSFGELSVGEMPVRKMSSGAARRGNVRQGHLNFIIPIFLNTSPNSYSLKQNILSNILAPGNILT